jgi:uncharacterized protein (DUF362 family)
MRFPLNRRQWFQTALAAAAPGLAPGASRLAMPGLYRGRVVAVSHPAAIVSGAYQAEPVRQMMRRGMRELTGDGGWADAWKQFVSPGDVVGIKVNPVGRPHVISAPEVLREIIDGLRAAGIPARDIVVYDRYRSEFVEAGFPAWLPEGVRWTTAVEKGDGIQQDIKGYDPDHYFEMALVLPGQDPASLTARRSYAALYITREVNKLINLCTLKDHQSAGVTLALKNLSHGLVNNVARSHGTRTLNACGAFIPTSVSLPVIRNKAVLHILDGIKGLYHGGPFARPQFIWEHRTLYFATDPVALDRIGWEVIDAKRVAVGRKPLAEELPDEFSTFLRKQPEHVEIAGALGLGEWNRNKIDLRAIALG